LNAQALELFGAGLFASIFGSMVGLGGGFLLVPLLRVVFNFGPAEAAGTSLVLVVANSASGALAYLLQKRVHVKIGAMLAVGGVPGSIIGALVVKRMSAAAFDWIFGIFLIAVAADMLLNREKRARAPRHVRDIAELKGMSYRAAVIAGFAVGLVSSLFGIGGGIIVVPTLLYFSELPTHAVSATSQFAILLTSPVGLAVHVAEHNIRFASAVPLVLGGLLGGPIGARLSLRLKSQQLLVLVATAMILAAASLALRHLIH
jgi:uncharacterized membrane protein YfcA